MLSFYKATMQLNFQNTFLYSGHASPDFETRTNFIAQFWRDNSVIDISSDFKIRLRPLYMSEWNVLFNTL